MKTLPLLVGGLWLAISPPVQAQDLDAQMQSLRKVGEEFAAASAVGGSLSAIADEYRNFSSNFSSLQSYIQDGNYDQGIHILKRWLARTKNEQIKKSLTELLKALGNQEAFAAKSE